MQKLLAIIRPFAIPLAWLQAMVAMVGSLYGSEILKFTPCNLCWYQRIALYPQTIILAIAMFRGDKKVWMYALPLAALGWLFGLYQNLLYYGVIPETIALCTNSTPCTTRYMSLFGFIDFPQLSLLALTVIIVLLFISREPKSSVIK